MSNLKNLESDVPPLHVLLAGYQLRLRIILIPGKSPER